MVIVFVKKFYLTLCDYDVDSDDDEDDDVMTTMRMRKMMEMAMANVPGTEMERPRLFNIHRYRSA